jgi:hypothetical protein
MTLFYLSLKLEEHEIYGTETHAQTTCWIDQVYLSKFSWQQISPKIPLISAAYQLGHISILSRTCFVAIFARNSSLYQIGKHAAFLLARILTPSVAAVSAAAASAAIGWRKRLIK